MNARSRQGFALLTALFALLVVSAVALDAALRAQTERRAAWNLTVEVRERAAAWGGIAHALRLLRELQARSVSTDGSDPSLFEEWNRVDTLLAGPVTLPGAGVYRVAIRDAASRLGVNTATANELYRLFRMLGAEDGLARSVALGIVARRVAVAPFEALGPLRAVEGFAQLPHAVSEYLTVVGDGTVNLNTAPEPVLQALPGLTSESVTWLLTRREAGAAVRGLSELAVGIAAPARRELEEHFAELEARTRFEPAALEIVATGEVRGSRLRTVLRVVAARAGSTLQITRTFER